MAARRLQVLHIVRTLAPETGGIVSYVAAAVSKSPAVDNWVATSEGSHDPPQGLRRAFAPRAVLGAWELRRWLAAHVKDYDVVHVHGIFSWPLFQGAAVCRAREVPFVVSSHGHLYPWSLAQKHLRKSVYLRMIGEGHLRAAAAIVATTQHEADALLARFPGLRVEIVPPGIEAAEQPPVAKPAGQLQVVFLGRFSTQKGLPILIHAMATLVSRGIDARLCLLGSGTSNEEQALRELVTELDLTQHVDFRGFVAGEERNLVLRRAHVFALPSYMENFSFATGEALAQGLPVVVSNAVALSALVEQYDCGQVVPVGDASALADALQCYRDPARQHAEAIRAYDLAQNALSLEHMGESLHVLYRKVAVTPVASR